MKILISGAGGFIGTYAVRHLQHRHEIHALDISPNRLESDSKVHWYQHDLTTSCEAANLPEHIDAVIHLAQSRHYRQFPEMAEDIFQVNISSTFHLLEYARRAGARHFILASTGSVYQSSDDVLSEDSAVNPPTFYAASKYAAELLVNSYRPFFNSIIFRLFFVYGPGQKGMLIPGLLEKVIQQQNITLDGNPGLYVNPTYVTDVVRAFEAALQLEYHHTINIAGDEIVSLTSLVKKMEEVSHRTAAIEYSGTSSGRLVADNRRMKSILKIEPQTSLLEGLKAMLGG